MTEKSTGRSGAQSSRPQNEPERPINRTVIEQVFAPWLDLPVWVTWRSVETGDGSKPKKLPTPDVNAKRLPTYHEAKGNKIGIVLGRAQGLGGIDPDGCRDFETGEISEAARDEVQAWDTYTEVSPSGTGLKAFALGAPKSLPFNVMRTDELTFEAYVADRFFAVTGWHVEGTPMRVCDCSAQWKDLGPRLKQRKAALASEAAGRDDWLFKLGCSMRARNVPEEAIWAAMVEANARADASMHPNFAEYGPLPDRDLKVKFRQVMKYKAGPSTGDDQQYQSLLAGLNRRYFVSKIEGRTVVAEETFDEILQRRRLLLSTAADIKLMYDNQLVLFGEKYLGLGSAWLRYENRRTFTRIVLVPKGPVPEGAYNLWRGFGVEPKAGKWPTIEAHLLDVVCSGNEEYYVWLVRWMAYCVQNPERQAEVAVALRGAKGTGKGAVGQLLRRIFSDHSVQIFHQKHLTGQFNSHLMNALFLHVDEAFWAGDKQGDNALKGLITERTLFIEPKHVNGFEWPNRLKVLMCANADWVVPATHDERRYFMLEIAEDRKGDTEYFSKLFAAIEGDEASAFLAHLLGLDLSEFDHRNPPHTEALGKQKLLSGDSLTKWWHDCLHNGDALYGLRITDDDYPAGHGTNPWPESVPKQATYSAYMRYASSHGDRWPVSDAHFTLKLMELLPDGELRSCRPRGADPKRPPHYVLPPLADCRAAFLSALKIGEYEWPEEPPKTQEEQQKAWPKGVTRGVHPSLLPEFMLGDIGKGKEGIDEMLREARQDEIKWRQWARRRRHH